MTTPRNSYAHEPQQQRPDFFGAVGRAFTGFINGLDRFFRGFHNAVNAWWNRVSGRERENALYYDNRTGTLVHHRDGQRITLATGLLSGRGDGLNNPEKQYEKNRGVTPEGGYNLSFGHSNRAGIGKYVRMDPIDNSQMRGRDGILMHHGSLASGERGSLGCITFKTPQQRDQIFDYIRRNNIGKMWVFDSGNHNRLTTFYSQRPAEAHYERAGPLPPLPRPAHTSLSYQTQLSEQAFGHDFRTTNYADVHYRTPYRAPVAPAPSQYVAYRAPPPTYSYVHPLTYRAPPP